MENAQGKGQLGDESFPAGTDGDVITSLEFDCDDGTEDAGERCRGTEQCECSYCSEEIDYDSLHYSPEDECTGLLLSCQCPRCIREFGE